MMITIKEKTQKFFTSVISFTLSPLCPLFAALWIIANDVPNIGGHTVFVVIVCILFAFLAYICELLRLKIDETKRQSEKRKVAIYKWQNIPDKSGNNRQFFSNGLFHQWGSDYEEFEEGPGNYATAIVELPDGKIENVPAGDIEFLTD